MKPLRILTGLGALALLAIPVSPAHGAWNNVFQVTCFFHHNRTSAYVAAPAFSSPVAAADPCCAPPPCCPPPPVCTTRYVQRCFYQPVTTFQTKTYYEPVTTYRTSFFYEPVTTYRYSCYFDPCTCTTKQVACPVTSYCLRSQCCPVQSWVQRCCSVPVTSYQQAFYFEPVTTCCQPAATPCCGAAAPAVAAPVPAAPATPAPPGVFEQKTPAPTAPPPIQEKTGSYLGPQAPPTSYRPASPPPPPPPVRLDRIVVGPDAHVEGRVVSADRTPRANAELTFISADRLAPRQEITANSAGRFRVTLAPGGWIVFINGPDGTPTYHSRIEVGDQPAAQVTLVSR
jgi:hypothetical protein